MKLLKKIVKGIIPEKIFFLLPSIEKKFYAKLINKNDLCFDIGSNVGRKSKLMLSCGARVIAFEPQSSCFKSLSKIKNSRFKFYSYAVGNRNEEKKLNLSNHSELATLSDRFIKYHTTSNVYWNKTEIVEVKSLDYLIKKFGLPNFCKIDTEGYELEILSNLTARIPVIEFEFTGKLLGDTFKIIDVLEKYRFNYILNENLNFQEEKWLSGDDIKKALNELLIENLHGNLFCKIQYD